MRTFGHLPRALLLACLVATHAPAAASRPRAPEAAGGGRVGAPDRAGLLRAAQSGAPARENGGQVYNVKGQPFGAKGDGRTLAGCSIAAGSAALTCAPGFTAADASKLLVVPGAGPAGADLSTTVLSYNSAAEVTLAARAAAAVRGKTVTYATNDTAAIQSAVNAAGAAGGGVVSLPGGLYGFTGLTVASDNVWLEGSGPSSVLATFRAAGDSIAVSNGATFLYGAAVRNLKFRPAVARASGVEVRADNFNVLYLENLWFENTYDCLKLGRAANLSVIAYVNNIRAVGYHQFVYITRVLDLWAQGWSLAADRADSESIRIDGGCEGLHFASGDAVNIYGPPAKSGAALRVKAQEYTASPPREIFFTGFHFDSHFNSVVAESGYRVHFVNCWFQGYDYGVYVPAASTATDWTFGHCNAARSSKEAFLFGSGAGWVIDSSVIMNNGCAGMGSDGVAVGSNTTGVTITDSTLYNGGQVGETACAQGYGVHVYAGAKNVLLRGLNVGLPGRTNAAGGIRIDPGADYFHLDGIMARGYAGSGLSNGAGTGPTKVVGTVFQ